MSLRVGPSAVAVSAMRGTSGKRSCSTESCAIFGAEIMAPLRDAMRLVDGEERDVGARQQIEAALLHQPLRRDIDEIERAAAHGALDFRAPPPAAASN